MIEIKNKIIKTELVEWKKLTFIQSDTFKKLKPELFEKPKESLIGSFADFKAFVF